VDERWKHSPALVKLPTRLLAHANTYQDPTRNLQEGADLEYELPTSSSSSISTPSSAKEKVGKARTAQYQEDVESKNLSSSVPLHIISERITLVSSTASNALSFRINHGGGAFHRCEDEPIHIPGAIQRFGALVALTPSADGGEWSVRIASENCADVLGYSPEQLFKLSSFANILYDESSHDFEDSAAAVWAGRFSDRGETQLEISSVALKPRHGKFNTLWCAMHVADGDAPILICEFEDQRQRPSRESHERTGNSASLAQTVSSIQQHKKQMNADSHLRSLRAARLRRASLNVLDTVNAVADIQQQLGVVESVQELLELVTVMVRELTQFHRVMLYQFDKGANGTVVAESVDADASEDRYEGLRFPHTDIPKQARDLYKINKIRVLYSRDEETARLVCNTPQDAVRPLDLTHSYLRAMSPIHLKYLANMGVCASMSISLIVNRELWGLIACHSYTPMRLTLPLRELCRTLGTSASTNITKLIYASRLEHRKTLVTGTVKATPSSLVTASSLDLLRIFDADFGLLAIDGEVRAIGKLDPYMEALAVLNFVNHSQFGEITMSDHMIADFPSEETLASLEILAGMLVVPLSKDRSDFIVFIRKGQVKDVHWAGNPNEKGIKSGHESNLEPRSSFKIWTEQVRGTSRAWTSDQCRWSYPSCWAH
jgi:light-regulated signal transduction histidine kinase (bacteriophytochrome)